MKRILSVLFICVCLLALGFVFSACEDEVVSIAIKNGESVGQFYYECFVGDEVDLSNVTLLVRTKKSSYEIALDGDGVLISNFSSDQATQKITVATVKYKGQQTTFKYFVKEREITNTYNIGDVTITYDGIFHGFTDQIIAAYTTDQVNITIYYNQRTKNGLPGENFVGVKEVGEYTLDVVYSKLNYITETRTITFKILPKQVGVEFVYAPGSLALAQRTQLTGWRDWADSYWKQELPCFEGYQIFARIKDADTPASDKKDQQGKENMLTSITFGAVNEEKGINSQGSISGAGEYKIQVNSSNKNFNVVCGDNNICTFKFKKANSSMVYENNYELKDIDSNLTYTATSLEDEVMNVVNLNSLTLTKVGSTYSLSLGTNLSVTCPITKHNLPLNPTIKFTENNDDSVSVAIVFDFDYYTSVTLSRTFAASSIA